MRKILIIAAREYRAMVGTKAFAVSIAMMPILMFGSMFAMKMLRNVGKVQDRTIAVIDHTGKLFEVLEAAAKTNNSLLEQMQLEQEEVPEEGGSIAEEKIAEEKVAEEKVAPKKRTARRREDDFGPSMSKGNRYFLERADPAIVTDETRIELSQRIRQQQLYAFVEIPAEVLQSPELPFLDGSQSPEDIAASVPGIDFHSLDSTLAEARQWVDRVLNETIKAKRLEAEGINPLVVMRASQRVPVRGKGLVERDAAGTVAPIEEKDEMTAIFLPLISMMLMFMVIFMAAQPMLESVMEEKSQRIAEVLLGSANPTQLMAGKLLGTVGGSITIFGIYAVGGYFAAERNGWLDTIPFRLFPWFIVFQIFGVMLYAAIFMAVGASVTQLKEAQSMLLPVWMVLMIPMFIWFQIIRDPDSSLATILSLIPPITPSMMILRMATGTTVPLWQPVLGLVLLILTTILVVILSGRIFRVGILWQGKTPKFSEMFRWAIGLS